VGTCSVLPGGVAILAETVLTSQRRCLSRFELGAKDVAAISPVQSLEADFELQLDLDCIEWQERMRRSRCLSSGVSPAFAHTDRNRVGGFPRIFNDNYFFRSA